MDKEVICKKCGHVTDESFLRMSSKCSKCGNSKENFIILDDDFDTLEKKYEKEIQEECIKMYGKEVHSGMEFVDAYKEVIRQKYFYEHSDMIDEASVKIREYKSTPEYRKEHYNDPDPIPSSTNVPKCPICGSTNLIKLSTAGKVAKVGLFGLFGAGSLGKTYKCKNCGVKF